MKLEWRHDVLGRYHGDMDLVNKDGGEIIAWVRRDLIAVIPGTRSGANDTRIGPFASMEEAQAMVIATIRLEGLL